MAATRCQKIHTKRNKVAPHQHCVIIPPKVTPFTSAIRKLYMLLSMCFLARMFHASMRRTDEPRGPTLHTSIVERRRAESLQVVRLVIACPRDGLHMSMANDASACHQVISQEHMTGSREEVGEGGRVHAGKRGVERGRGDRAGVTEEDGQEEEDFRRD